MNKNNVALAIIMGLIFAKGVFAADPETEKEEFDINSITYIQVEDEIDLGFNTADYLPEGFNPYEPYVDLNAIEFIEDKEEPFIDTSSNLPEGFDAYADPKGIAGINYIDENDSFTLGFNAENYLPQDFNPHKK